MIIKQHNHMLAFIGRMIRRVSFGLTMILLMITLPEIRRKNCETKTRTKLVDFILGVRRS